MKKIYRNIHITKPIQLDEYNKIVDRYLNDKKYVIPKNFPVVKLLWKKIPLCYFSVGNLRINNDNISFKPYGLRYIIFSDLSLRYYLNFDYKFSYDLSDIKSIDRYKYENIKTKLNINMIKLVINNDKNHKVILLWIEKNYIFYEYATEKMYKGLIDFYKGK